MIESYLVRELGLVVVVLVVPVHLLVSVLRFIYNQSPDTSAMQMETVLHIVRTREEHTPAEHLED